MELNLRGCVLSFDDFFLSFFYQATDKISKVTNCHSSILSKSKTYSLLERVTIKNLNLLTCLGWND